MAHLIQCDVPECGQTARADSPHAPLPLGWAYFVVSVTPPPPDTGPFEAMGNAMSKLAPTASMRETVREAAQEMGEAYVGQQRAHEPPAQASRPAIICPRCAEPRIKGLKFAASDGIGIGFAA